MCIDTCIDMKYKRVIDIKNIYTVYKKIHKKNI